MHEVSFDKSPFAVVISADAAPRDGAAQWAGLVSSTDALARPLPGYGGTIWLAQGRALGPASTTDTELLMGFLFWRSSSEAEAFSTELSRARTKSEFVDDLLIDEGIYQFSATVTADASTHVDPVRYQAELATEIIKMTPVSGKQGWVGEYNESETRDHIKNLDGFVSASFFRDLRSDRIVEYVQWRSAADSAAALGDARFAEHLSVNSHYSAGKAFLFGERLAGDTV
ncbi:hypothetical protein E4P29_15370 [Rhodococcus sp. 1R11]|uniref:hypothetical protein n=1 Tax=unclassified Rhodococcus (in: high G+C Gram-positive bacteria) TaxID=192944 RepID=UPI0010720A27|nr:MULTISPECIES: hypothetical protein [unclassified Rhodococcus (in: high G+C Gram-positive bacteria)]MDI9933619.1 hypothetical protein [Rhodococcus sp. IEGM 1354]TFI42450.1 hypothetical protein E4P29_15370 [Rhodococcus sp. 1R11]